MDIEIPSDKVALKIWWALSWRTLIMAFLVSFLASIIINAIAHMAGASPADVQVPAAIAGGLLGLYVSVKVIKYLMTKGFGDYRLVLVRK